MNSQKLGFPNSFGRTVSGYAGPEMGMSEAEVDSRHSLAEASQLTPAFSNVVRDICCMDYSYRGSEMGLSDLHVETLHADAKIIRMGNITKTKVHGICSNCPKSANFRHIGNSRIGSDDSRFDY